MLSLSFIGVTKSAIESSQAFTMQGTIASGPVSYVWSQNCEEMTDFTTLGITYGFDTPSGYVYTDPHGNPSNYADIIADFGHSGSRSIRLTSGGQGSNGRIELDMYPNGWIGEPQSNTITTDFYYSWWVYLPANLVPSGSYEWLVLFQLEARYTSGCFPIAKLMVNSDGSTFLEWQALDGSQHRPIATAGAIPRNQWVHFEWYTKIDVNGRITWWLDGNTMWDISYDTSGLTAAPPLYFMNMIYGMPGTCYIDDMTLYNVNMNGSAP